MNPKTLDVGRQLDTERKTKGRRSLLHGIPVVLKHNIDTADLMPTTAGSVALEGSIPSDDAFIVKRLREANTSSGGEFMVHSTSRSDVRLRLSAVPDSDG